MIGQYQNGFSVINKFYLKNNSKQTINKESYFVSAI